MDIKTISNNGLGARPSDSGNAGRANNAVASGTQAKPTDKVTLTASTHELEQKALNANVDNSEKIARLKQAIQEGSYEVNAQKVASKLIETEALIAGA